MSRECHKYQKCRKQFGLSLMEMLVVLVLTSLIATLLLQGTMFLYGNYARVSEHQSQLEAQILPLDWYRKSINQLVASLDDKFSFQGTGDGFTGYTFSSINGLPGQLTKVAWELQREDQRWQLWYQQDGQPGFRVMTIDAVSADFKYLGVGTKASPEWPNDVDNKNVLPHQIVLEIVEQDGRTKQIDAAIASRKRGIEDFRDFL